MDYFRINGRTYNVTVTDIEESFTILYSENTGRTMAVGAEMVLDPLGTFFGHNVTVEAKAGCEAEYDELYAYISRPRFDGVYVKALHDQTTIEYKAYVSQGKRNVKRLTKDGNVIWGEMSLNFVPMRAQVLPE